MYSGKVHQYELMSYNSLKRYKQKTFCSVWSVNIVELMCLLSYNNTKRIYYELPLNLHTYSSQLTIARSYKDPLKSLDPTMSHTALFPTDVDLCQKIFENIVLYRLYLRVTSWFILSCNTQKVYCRTCNLVVIYLILTLYFLERVNIDQHLLSVFSKDTFKNTVIIQPYMD